MAEQAIFKSQTFGGFNKEEVLKYIDNMNAEHSAEQEKNVAEISSLSTELAEKTENLDELQKKYDEIMEAYEELRQHYLMLKEHSDNIEADNEKLAARLEKSEKELAIEKELNSQLEDRIEEFGRRDEEHAAKERKFMASVEEAGRNAKLILAAAKSGAQGMISEAESSAEEINGEIDAFRAELEKTKSFMEDSLSVLVQRLEYIGKSVDGVKFSSEGRNTVSADIQKKYEELVCETETKTKALKDRFFR